MSWHTQGQAGLNQAQQEIEELKNAPKELVVRVKEQRLITLLDTEGFNFYQHRIQEGNDWMNAKEETCLGSGCPLCEAGYPRYFNQVYTVLDLAGYKNNDKVQAGQGKRYLWKLKATQATDLTKLIAELGGNNAIGCVLQVQRNDKKEARSGSSFRPFLRENSVVEVSLEDIAASYKTKYSVEVDISEVDVKTYLDFYQPKTVQSLQALYCRKKGGSDFSGSGNQSQNQSQQQNNNEFNSQSNESFDIPF